jgi:hypothetical protein
METQDATHLLIAAKEIVHYPLCFILDTVIFTWFSFMSTFQTSSSPAPRSINLATPSGIVVLSEGELGLRY